jgi:hypothetical protein
MEEDILAIALPGSYLQRETSILKAWLDRLAWVDTEIGTVLNERRMLGKGAGQSNVPNQSEDVEHSCFED